jgi:ribosomal protein S18 acetylase RimI-like enzyme
MPHMLNPQALSALPRGVRCRPADAADTGFLRDLHAHTRALDLALLDVAPTLLATLLTMQFDAQGRHHRQQHPGCMPWVIERHGQALGQMWLHLDDHGLHLMDIAVLPAHQGQGLASTCVQALLQLADHHAWPVHLHVLADNPIRHWYARLGFAVTAEAGLHQAMTRPAVEQETRYEQA